MSVVEGVVSICRGDGSLVHVPLAEFAGKLLKIVATNMWQDALQVYGTFASHFSFKFKFCMTKVKFLCALLFKISK